jgi:hypothetical protein
MQAETPARTKDVRKARLDMDMSPPVLLQLSTEFVKHDFKPRIDPE